MFYVTTVADNKVVGVFKNLSMADYFQTIAKEETKITFREV